MDRFVLIAYIFSAIPIISSVFAYKIYEQNPVKADKYNSYTKIIVPITFILLVLTISGYVIDGSVNTIETMSFFK